MYKKKKVYPYTFTEARDRGELALCRESYKLNKECIEAINEAVKESNYELYHYDLKSAALKVANEYGLKRLSWVTANIIQNMEYDGRISQRNKDWAKSFDITKDDYSKSFYTNTHATIFDSFTNYVTQLIRQQEIEKKKPSLLSKAQDKLESAPKEEADLFYSSNKSDKQTGCIGYLRMDFGKSGNEFSTNLQANWCSLTWFNHQSELNTSEFKNDFDKIINSLRKDGILKDFSAMSEYCGNNPSATLDDGRGYNYGFKLTTEKYAYYLRCGTIKGDYNLYCLAYDRSVFDKYLPSLYPEKDEKSKSLLGDVKEKAAAVKNTETKEKKNKKNDLEV